MNLEDAILSMVAGHKIKLPEWVGFWYIPFGNVSANMENEIRVFLKNGDVVNTPWVDKYRERKDFEVTDGALGYDFVVHALDNGKKLARHAWNGKDIWIKKVNPHYFDIATPIIESKGIEIGPFIGIKTAQNTFECGWKPTNPDMFAKDWYVVDYTFAELERPPLGLRPMFIAHESRIKEIQEAILRYRAINKEIPKEWTHELLLLQSKSLQEISSELFVYPIEDVIADEPGEPIEFSVTVSLPIDLTNFIMDTKKCSIYVYEDAHWMKVVSIVPGDFDSSFKIVAVPFSAHYTAHVYKQSKVVFHQLQN